MNPCAKIPGRNSAALFALKARQIIPLGPAATGSDLFSPPKILDNHALVIRNGHVVDITRTPPVPPHDLGDVALLPPLANAHVHLQLSWLSGKTRWHKGFTPWLKTLIPHVLANVGGEFGTAEQLTALENACATLVGCIAGDVGGSLPGALAQVHAAASKHGLEITHFCENFGFAQMSNPWPIRSWAEVRSKTDILSRSSPAGHALYSTAMETLRKAKNFCDGTDRVFTFHLAESPEETELLVDGAGPLHDLYRDTVLPENWRPPLERPFAFALKNGLLNKGTLAVHGTQLSREELAQFAHTGAALCLCPRSNSNLGVGLPPVRDILQKNILCCLGTDGLTSNTDLDVRNEAAFLQKHLDVPTCALWRMATVNGAAALHRGHTSLRIGGQAGFSIWPLV